MSIDLPPPVPAASAHAAEDSCSVSDSDPRIDRLVAPVYTEAMHERNKAGIVDVSIDLRPDGTIAKATITLSSGDVLLDGATYNAALATTYRPAVRNCQYIAGSYIFRARYRSAPTGGEGHPEPETPGPFAAAAPLAAPTPAPGTAKSAAPASTPSPAALPAPVPSAAASAPAPPPSPAPAAPSPAPAPSSAAAAATPAPSAAPSPAPASGSAAAGSAPVPGGASPAPSPAASAAPATSR